MNHDSNETSINPLLFQQSPNSIERSHRGIRPRGQDLDLPDPALLVHSHEIRKRSTDVDSYPNRVSCNHRASWPQMISHPDYCLQDSTGHVRLSPTLNIVPVHPKTFQLT